MKPSSPFSQIVDDQTIAKTVSALTDQGFTVEVVDSVEEAKDKVLAALPIQAEVFTLSSETLRLSGISEAIDQSGDYQSVRQQLGQQTELRVKRKLGSSPDYAIGSVQALTEDGHIWLASATGSQLASCVYGAEHVIYVVGAQKIVRNDEKALERIREYTLPLETARAQAAYGNGSRIGKLLQIIDDRPGRTSIYLIKESIGF